VLRTDKAGNEGTAENSHTGHCTRAVGSADVKVQNVCHWEMSLCVP